MRPLQAVVFGAVLLVVLAPEARAEPSDLPVEPSTWGLRLRIDLPAFSWQGTEHARGSVGGDGLKVSIVGGSAAFIYRWLTVEGGGGYHFFSGPYAFARGGALLTLLDTRGDRSRGWQLQLPLLLGYHYLDRQVDEDGGKVSWEKDHCMDLGTGLEATYWLRRHFGLSARLLLNGLITLDQTQGGHDMMHPLLGAFNFGLGLGISI